MPGKIRLVPSAVAVRLGHSTRYTAGKRMAVTDAANNNVYTWHVRRTKRRVDRTEVVHYECSGCVALKHRDPQYALRDVPQKTALTTGEGLFWASDSGLMVQHFCTPYPEHMVDAREIARNVKHQIAEGTRRSLPSSAATTICAEITTKYGKEKEKLAECYKAATGKDKIALQQSLQTARNKRYKIVSSFMDLKDNPRLESYRFTMRALNCKEGDDYFQEKMLHYADHEMAIFIPTAQRDLLRRSKYIFCDGTFKFAPAKCAQVYRIFGLIQFEDGTYIAYPFVTALLTGKTEQMYKKLFIQVRDMLKAQVEETGHAVKWKAALMDCEIAAVNSFNKVLTKEFHVDPFMCSFHVKAALNRCIAQTGLQEEYRLNEDVQTIVRMIGALQILDPDLWEQAEAVITESIQAIFDPDVNKKLNIVFEYYKKQWLLLDKRLGFKFFSLFDLPKNAPRTTNVAESYHGKQRNYFTKKPRLGTWIADFQRCLNVEIMDCESVDKGLYSGKRESYKAVNEKIAKAKLTLRDYIGDTTANSEHDTALEEFLIAVGYAMGVGPAKTNKKITVDGTECEKLKKKKKKKANAERDVSLNTDADTDVSDMDDSETEVKKKKIKKTPANTNADDMDESIVADTIASIVSNVSALEDSTLETNERAPDTKNAAKKVVVLKGTKSKTPALNPSASRDDSILAKRSNESQVRRQSSLIFEKEVNRRSEIINRKICYEPLSPQIQQMICAQFYLKHVENKELNYKKRTFRSEWTKPQRTVKTAGDGNCYFHALSIRASGTTENHDALRRAILGFAEEAKKTDKLLANAAEVPTIPIARRKSPATAQMTTAANHCKWASFPHDFIAASKCLQVNIIVFNDKDEWEVYRPDAISYRPLLDVPQENVASIALEFKMNHVTVINTFA